MNTFTIRKKLQGGRGIVADGRQPQAAFREIASTLLQLDQLAFAERSPVGGPVKDKHRPLRSAYGFERPHLPILVGQAEIRDFCARSETLPKRGEIENKEQLDEIPARCYHGSSDKSGLGSRFRGLSRQSSSISVPTLLRCFRVVLLFRARETYCGIGIPIDL
jgi:hypothetical protein